MKRLFVHFLLLFAVFGIYAQQYRKPVKPVKNVILMIPDGTSTSVLSVARWFQSYNGGAKNLNLDPYLCGLVKVYISNSPVPDSAPAMSAYMTGVLSQAGNISICPPVDSLQDIEPVDPKMTYQPLVTVMEAAKIEKQKAIGVVVTAEFCHATPGACASHHYNRDDYKYLAPQMAYNNLDVVFGGGYKAVTDDMKKHFEETGTKYIKQDVDAFHNFSGKEKVWALFSPGHMPYDIDRGNLPSLAEMTQKALDKLDKNENGFFLMVEGSKVDMAAHANDPIGIITDFLAFDKAVGLALDYAKKNGETAVVVLPDHGNSGFTFGNKDYDNYSERGLDDIFANVSKYKLTAKGLEGILLNTKPEEIKSVFNEYTGIDLTDDEVKELMLSKNYKEADYTQVSNTKNMVSTITHIMTNHTNFGFISGNHTGEDVFLAAYHPQGDVPIGLNTNTEINKYLCDLVGLKTPLSEYTKSIFAKHSDVFKGYEFSINEKGNPNPTLNVKKGKKTLVVNAFTSVAYLDGKPFDLGSVVVYIDKNKTFYLPANLADKLQ